ncbi:hypothetical protein DIPPA_09830, partial [Diplonema papillatum]
MDLFDIGEILERSRVQKKGSRRPDINDYYAIDQTLRPLGKGAFGVVRKCVAKGTGFEYAVKIIKKTNLSPAALRSIHSEVQVQQQLRHCNIVQLIETFETSKVLYIVLELVSGGQLLGQKTDSVQSSDEEDTDEKGQGDEAEAGETVSTGGEAKAVDQDTDIRASLQAKRGSVPLLRGVCHPEFKVRKLATCLVRGLEYLHSRGIVHRDLKPSNIVLSNADEWGTAKITDFGFARVVGQDRNLTSTTGTHSFMAPEVMAGQVYGIAVDMWSLGVLLFYLLTGNLPFAGSSPRQHKPAFGEPVWRTTSPEARSFVSLCLVHDTAKRLTAEEATGHPWLHSFAATSLARNEEGEGQKEITPTTLLPQPQQPPPRSSRPPTPVAQQRTERTAEAKHNLPSPSKAPPRPAYSSGFRSSGPLSGDTSWRKGTACSSEGPETASAAPTPPRCPLPPGYASSAGKAPLRGPLSPGTTCLEARNALLDSQADTVRTPRGGHEPRTPTKSDGKSAFTTNVRNIPARMRSRSRSTDRSPRVDLPLHSLATLHSADSPAKTPRPASGAKRDICLLPVSPKVAKTLSPRDSFSAFAGRMRSLEEDTSPGSRRYLSPPLPVPGSEQTAQPKPPAAGKSCIGIAGQARETGGSPSDASQRADLPSPADGEIAGSSPTPAAAPKFARAMGKLMQGLRTNTRSSRKTAASNPLTGDGDDEQAPPTSTELS